MKRTPIKRKTSLKSQSQLVRKTPLRYRSKKTQEVYETERIPLVVDILENNPWCTLQVEIQTVDSTYDSCTRRATEVNEIVPRGRGGSITDPSNVRGLCHQCHFWVTTHPALAEQIGAVKHSWER